MSRALRFLSIACFAAALPSTATAQQPPDTTAVEPREVEAMFLEFQQLHMRLEELQDQALRDPGISAAQEALGQEIQRAIESRDPTMPERMARAAVLESEANAAQQSGDTERLDELIEERQSIQDHFFTIQQQVVSEPEMARKIMAFQARLEDKMMQLNPDARGLIERFRELETRLQAALDEGV